MATPKSRNRPWRAIVTLALAVAAVVAVHVAGIPLAVTNQRAASKTNTIVSLPVGHLITVVSSIAVLVFAVTSTFAFAGWARDALGHFIGEAYGAIVRYVMILVGISLVVLIALSMLGFPIGQLVVGGAVTGVLLTIAAQQSLANLFAGVVLQFARPFRVGDQVRIRSGALAGTIEGTVAEFSITYVRMHTAEGPILLPNSQVLAAAVSPLPPADEAAGAGAGVA
ncbi:MAG: mechanosensitive ion channel family protein [Nocardiopsaceae bacterium]|nr:mechanosensitive ion channel family protein [Nocardiopsaceae bacterium]